MNTNPKNHNPGTHNQRKHGYINVNKTDKQIIGADKLRQEDTGEVPLYRSYGTTKKVNPWLILANITLTKILGLIFFAFQFFIMGMVLFFIFLYGGTLLPTLITVTASWIILGLETRAFRRRAKFIRRIKRFSKKNGFLITFTQTLLDSLYWNNDEKLDFILETDKEIYYVKFATAKSSLTTMTFLSKSEMRYTKHRRRSAFQTIMGAKDKTKIMKINFPDFIDESNPKERKIIITNPQPRDIFVKTNDGVIVPTGSGERIHGYTIYSGAGFMEMLRRMQEETEENK